MHVLLYGQWDTGSWKWRLLHLSVSLWVHSPGDGSHGQHSITKLHPSPEDKACEQHPKDSRQGSKPKWVFSVKVKGASQNSLSHLFLCWFKKSKLL